MDAGLGIEGFAGAALLMEAGDGVEVRLRIHAEAVGAAAGIEVMKNPHVTQRAGRREIISADHARATLLIVGFDEIERLIVRGDGDAVGALDFGFGEQTGELLIGVEAVDGSAGEVREVQAILRVVGDVVGPGEGLALKVIRQHFDLAGLEVGAGEARLHLFGGMGRAAKLGTFERGAFAGDEVAVGMVEQAVGRVAALAEDRQFAFRRELHDALVDGLRKVDVAGRIGRGAFREGGDGGGGGFEFRRRLRRRGAGGEQERGKG